MKVARIHAAGDVRIHVEPEPTPGSDETLVRVLAVGLCGSDLHWYAESGLGADRLERPLVLGHEFAGLTPDGQMVAVSVDLSAGSIVGVYPVVSPTDGSTLLVPVFASDFGLTAAAPRFAYTVQSFSGTGNSDALTNWAGFNAFNNAVSTAAYGTLAPGQRASVPLTIDPAEWKLTPALGVMVVGLENFNGSQTRLLGIGRAGDGQ